MINICRSFNKSRIYINSAAVRLMACKRKVIIQNSDNELQQNGNFKITYGPSNEKKFPSLLDIPFVRNPFDNNQENTNIQTNANQPINVNCGDLRTFNVGQVVKMSGRFSRKGVGNFALIKDKSGYTQLIIQENQQQLWRRFNNMPQESLITIIGTVYRRPLHTVNMKILTGEIEVEVEKFVNIELPVNTRKTMKRSFSTMAETRTTGITNTEYRMSKSENILKYFENREQTCNDLNLNHVGKEVELVGWISVNKKIRFQQLKDGYGTTQILFLCEDFNNLKKEIKNIPDNAIVLVKGTVVARPTHNINSKLSTGEVEVNIKEIRLLNPDDPYDGPIKVKSQKMSIEESEPIVENKPTIVENKPTIVDNKPTIVDNKPTIVDNKPTKSGDTNKFTCRTHNCGELRSSNIMENVTLCGWVQYQRMNKFIVLRDGYGSTQIMIPETCTIIPTADEISLETIIKVDGIVAARPENMKNAEMLTGDIEIHANQIEILNKANKNLPFDVRNFNRAKEPLRLEHRYIDLRFEDMQRNLRLRSTVLMKMREYLINYLGFVEVETPTLFRRTPGGAQEFIVPTRKSGHFYSLVQSPQQFKQMLMAGAIDRYFQIARCYRDEATRPDRQPEFTQLDIELSFSDRHSIMALIEETLLYCWPTELPKITIPFQTMTYADAMSKYGSDKPDTSFDLTFTDVEDILIANNELSCQFNDFAAYCIVVRQPISYFSHAIRKPLEKIAQEYPNSKFIFHKIKELGFWPPGLEKFLSSNVCQSLQTQLKIQPEDVILLAFGTKTQTQIMLGRLRIAYMEMLKEHNQYRPNPDNKYNFLWVTDFPLFSWNDETNQIESVHHPFTAPAQQDCEKLNSGDLETLLSMRSQAYDLVLNGQEIGGGSIRIHDNTMQKYILEEILKIEHSHLEHLLSALESGCPPHGGIALGLDRLLGIMCNVKSIRDVIAFPKGLDGKDHLSKAPVPISDHEKQLYGIEIVPKRSPSQ